MHDYISAFYDVSSHPTLKVNFYVYNGEEMSDLYAKMHGMDKERAEAVWLTGQAEEKKTAKVGWSSRRDESYVMMGNWALPPNELPNLTPSAAHELFHAYQTEFGTLSPPGHQPDTEVPGSGPRWMVEGTASYFNYRAAHPDDYPEIRKWRVQLALNTQRALRRMEPYKGGLQGQGYHLPAMAVELLASIAGEKALVDFYLLQQPGTTWEWAFEEAFGMKVGKFYDIFEQHQAAGLPEVEILKTKPTYTPTPTFTPNTTAAVGFPRYWSTLITAESSYWQRLFR